MEWIKCLPGAETGGGSQAPQLLKDCHTVGMSVYLSYVIQVLWEIINSFGWLESHTPDLFRNGYWIGTTSWRDPLYSQFGSKVHLLGLLLGPCFPIGKPVSTDERYLPASWDEYHTYRTITSAMGWYSDSIKAMLQILPLSGIGISLPWYTTCKKPSFG